MNQIVLRKGRERSALKGHPWVFSGAVERGDAAAGELVEVCDHSGAKIASGWYSPASQIRVRIVPDAPIAELVAAAVARRGDFFVNCYTNAVRLVNAESDLLPGVVADYYSGHVVCQFTSAGADARKNEIADALMKFAPGCAGVSERLDVDSRTKEGLPTEPAFSVLAGVEPPELVEIAEGPCRFLVDVRKGHKTGFYLDQRDARAAVGALANGADVLNCFSSYDESLKVKLTLSLSSMYFCTTSTVTAGEPSEPVSLTVTTLVATSLLVTVATISSPFSVSPAAAWIFGMSNEKLPSASVSVISTVFSVPSAGSL